MNSTVPYEVEFEAPAPVSTKQYTLLDVTALRRILWRQRKILIAVTVAGLLIGLLVALMLKPMYEATSVIRIEPPAAESTDSDAFTPYADLRYYDRYSNTLKGVLTSRKMALEVIDALDLTKDDSFFEEMGVELPDGDAGEQEEVRRQIAVGLLVGGVSMTNEPDTNIAQISFRSPDPQLAAKLVNTYTKTFVVNQATQRSESYDYARTAIEDQIAQARQSLAEAERNALAYSSRNRIIDTASQQAGDSSGGNVGSTGTSLVTSSLVSTNSQLSDARSARIEAEQNWNAVKQGNILDTPLARENSAIQTLVAQRSALRAELAEMRGRYLPDHPEITERTEQLAALDKAIAEAGQSLRNSIRKEYEIARGEERQLESQRDALMSETLNDQTKRVQLGILQREIAADRFRLSNLLDRLGELESAADINPTSMLVLDEALVPTAPFEPNMFKIALMALAIGLMTAIGIAVLRELLDDKIYAPDDAEERLNLALLGTTPLVDQDEGLDDIHSEIGEAYSSLRAALDVATGGNTNKTIVITSSRAGEGKTTTACALAQDFARINRRVLLVDADLRNPSVHRWFSLGNGSGTSDVLVNRTPISGSIQKLENPGLDVLTAGKIPSNPAQLLSTDVVPHFFEAARKEYDVVVIDCPPVLGLADAPMLARHADASVIIVESGKAHYSATRKAMNRLRMAGANLIGITVTKFKLNQPGYGYDYHYYRYDSQNAPS